MKKHMASVSSMNQNTLIHTKVSANGKWTYNATRPVSFQSYYSDNSTSILRRFTCHRSGIQPLENHDKVHRRFPKRSKKLNGFCPAELYVMEKKTDRTCEVRVQKTHVGHSITSEKELAFVSLDCKEKESIQTKISSGVEQSTIWKQYESKEPSSRRLK